LRLSPLTRRFVRFRRTSLRARPAAGASHRPVGRSGELGRVATPTHGCVLAWARSGRRIGRSVFFFAVLGGAVTVRSCVRLSPVGSTRLVVREGSDLSVASKRSGDGAF